MVSEYHEMYIKTMQSTNRKPTVIQLFLPFLK